MTLRTLVSAALIAPLLLAGVPISARAAGDPQPSPALRASIDRAVAHDAAAQKAVPPAFAARTPRGHASAATGAQMGGGGGGKGMMVMMLLGTAAGLAGTYYLVKELRKQTDAAQTNAGQ